MKSARIVAPNVRRTVMRDAHAPEQIAVRFDTNETPTVEQNKRIRGSSLLPQDSRNPFHPDDVIAFSFQFPTLHDLQRVRGLEPEIFGRLDAGGDEALRAAERLSLLYPQYVTITRRGDARRTRGRTYDR